MKKLFYTNGVDKFGPFSLEEFGKQNLTKETKVWFYGLDNWTPLSEVDELKPIVNSIPPPLKIAKPNVIKKNNILQNINGEEEIKEKPLENKKNIKSGIIITLITLTSLFVLLFSYAIYKGQQDNYKKQQDRKMYQEIVNSSYNSNVDFNFYVKKFYRDLGAYGIYPKKPKKIIIKFAKLDQIDNATHIEGVSYGIYHDDKIEIYINPSTWNKFNKPMRYWLMYHELSHDVLNLDDLKNIPKNKGKLMYPVLSSYKSMTMDDFIESSHALFKEVASKQNK